MRTRSLPALLGALWVVLLVVCAQAPADVFGPPTRPASESTSGESNTCCLLASAGNVLLSAGEEGTSQQAQYAHDPAISGNGRYVAFDGAIGGISGVWRRDLQTGEVQPVAVGRQVPGSEACESAHAPCEAELPSISADGNYVSFTTAAPLAALEDHNSAPDVYVRNMGIPVGLAEMEAPSAQRCEAEGPQAVEPARCAFTLVSAVNGGTEGLSYEGGSSSYGSIAAGRSAISADGSKVAFVTTAISNLAGPATPSLQVAVRDATSRSTQLVSVERDPATGRAIPGKPVLVNEGGIAYGAVFSPGGGPPLFPSQNRPYALAPAVGASISGDGSTVAWMGRDVFKQAPMLAQENVASYAEPLWRRIGDGPLAATQRITGGSEPENPACASSGETLLPEEGRSPGDPCQGPFAIGHGGGVYVAQNLNAIPQLSADGYTVVFLATAQLVERGANFGRGAEGEADDIYLANMREHPERKVVRALTELAGGVSSHAGSAPIVDFGVSADGRQIAFSTQRTAFPLGVPTFVSRAAAIPGMAELFDIDLANETLTRVTSSFEGGPSEHPHQTVHSGEPPYPSPADGAQSPSFSSDGNLIAFSSTASNLVYGDGNTPPPSRNSVGSADGADAFAVERRQFPALPVEGYVSAAPPNPGVTPEWRLGVTARSLSNGSVMLYVTAPGPGTLSAAADGGVPVTAARARRAKRGRGRRATIVVTRQLASAAHGVSSPDAVQQLVLTPPARFHSLAERSNGLSASARITFSAAGHPRLTETIAVTFLRRVPAQRARRARTHTKGGHRR
jgi:hypothetical protein